MRTHFLGPVVSEIERFHCRRYRYDIMGGGGGSEAFNFMLGKITGGIWMHVEHAKLIQRHTVRRFFSQFLVT